MKISPSRIAAYEILSRIENEEAYSSVLLPLYGDALTELDRSLCYTLTLGVLRSQLFLDRIIAEFSGKPAKKLDTGVLIPIRMGIFQLLMLDKVPDYSAINESVNLVKWAKKRSAAGLVNAVLRRAQKGIPDFDYADEIEGISVKTSHPKWLVEKWISHFGFEETADLSDANNQIPEAAFRLTFNSFKFPEKSEQILNDLIEKKFVRRSDLVPGCFLATKKIGELLDLAGRGLIYFQDPASQLVASLIKAGSGTRFLDLCASPGGKSTAVAARNRGQNAVIVSGDVYSHRIRDLKANFKKQGLDESNIVQYDAEHSLPFETDCFDEILVDAPCSGTGTIRHNPEIRYRISQGGIEALSRKQLTVLEMASKHVKPGGRIIYSTCSIEPEENEEVVGAFLSINRDFASVPPNIPQRYITGAGNGRTFPHLDNTDGFFIAVLTRRA